MQIKLYNTNTALQYWYYSTSEV